MSPALLLEARCHTQIYQDGNDIEMASKVSVIEAILVTVAVVEGPPKSVAKDLENCTRDFFNTRGTVRARKGFNSKHHW